MSLTAIGVMLVWVLGLTLALAWEPICALFAYLWIFYNDPQFSWWGSELPSLRYSLFAALIALAVAIRWRKPDRPGWLSTFPAKLILLYALWSWLQILWAVNHEQHMDGVFLFTKYAILSYVIYTIAPDARTLKLFLIAHVVGCFIFGLRAFNTDVSGRLETVGASGVDDANLLAAHVVTGAAIAGFLFLGLRSYARWICLAALPFILNTIVLTQSRGGFLSLVAAVPAALYLSPKKHRRIVVVAAVVGALAFGVLANETFWERMGTITQEAGSDSREPTRLDLLAPQFAMFRDYPLGAGNRGNEALSPRYMPPELLSNSGKRAAHNTFMAALVDGGLPGALMLILMYAWVFFTLRRLKKLDAQGLPEELGLYRAAIGSACTGVFIAGLFVNLLKFEVQVWLITALCTLDVLCKQAIAAKGGAAARVPARGPGTRRMPRLTRPRPTTGDPVP